MGVGPAEHAGGVVHMGHAQQKCDAVGGCFYGEIALGVFTKGPDDEIYKVCQEQQICCQTHPTVKVVNAVKIILHIVDVVSNGEAGQIDAKESGAQGESSMSIWANSSFFSRTEANSRTLMV